jgi:DNA-binding IclR family transcriptional regulator
MNNPGTRLALQIVRRLLSRTQDADRAFTMADFLHDEAAAGFSSSTLLRTLRLLEEDGWISRNPTGAYTLSREIQSACCAYASSYASAVHAHPFLTDLAQRTGESAAFAIWQGDGIAFSATCEMPDSFHYIPTGQINRYNLHNAFNITCMAYLDKKRREELFRKPQDLTLIPTIQDLEDICTRIKADGIFVWQDIVKRITAPVFYPGSLLAGVIGISFFKATYTDSDIASLKGHVAESASRITQVLQT